MGPCVGPLLGGWIGERAGWRWICEFIHPCLTLSHTAMPDWVLFIFTGVCFAFTLFIPETLAPVLLRRKAQRLRKETGDESYKTLEELERVPFSVTLKVALLRPIVMLLTEPIVIFMSFCAYLTFRFPLVHVLILHQTWHSSTACCVRSAFIPLDDVLTSNTFPRSVLLCLPHCFQRDKRLQCWNDWGDVHQHHGELYRVCPFHSITLTSTL